MNKHKAKCKLFGHVPDMNKVGEMQGELLFVLKTECVNCSTPMIKDLIQSSSNWETVDFEI